MNTDIRRRDPGRTPDVPVARRMTTTLAALGFFACGGSTGPDAEFDPVAMAAVVEGMLDATLDNQAVRSLIVLGPKIKIPSTAGVHDPLTDVAREIPILEPGFGRQLIYNAGTEAYEFDEDGSDVPQNGVRFLLYEVDSDNERVIVPLNPTGRLDVTDESAGGNDRVGVQAVVATEPLIDYEAIASGSIVVTTLIHEVDGFVDAGTSRVELQLQQRLSLSEGVELDYRLTRDQDAIRIQLQFDVQTSEATTTLTVASGGVVFSLTVSGTPQSIEGTVRNNDNEVARVSGSPTTPVFTGTDNTALTLSELNALRSLFDSPDLLLDVMDAILAPAYWVFGLSIFFQN